MSDRAELRRQVIAAVGHLNRALEEVESREGRLAILDAIYQLQRSLKRTSAINIPIPTQGETND